MTRTSASKAAFSIGVVATLVALAAAPTISALPDPGELPTTTYYETSLGFALDDNFDADDGGWDPGATPAPFRPAPTDVWQWGVPTSGPGVAASGSNVWATNLSGPYAARDCAALLSPPIDLTSATSASVAFQQWRHMQQLTTGSKFVNDAGVLYVTADAGETLTLVTPSGGYTSQLGSTVRPCMDGALTGALGLGGPATSTPPAPVYTAVTTDLTPFVGQVVQFVIAFGSDCCTHYSGWYVDDFAVTIDGVTTVEDFESGEGGFTVVSTRPHLAPLGWSHGEAAAGVGPSAGSPLWATNLEGDYGHMECAALESPAFEVGPLPEDPNLLARASLTWSQWFRSNSIYAAAVVQVGTADGYVTLTPEGGYPGTIGSTVRDQLVDCLGVDASQRVFSGTHDALGAPLKPMRADLTPWAGQEVTLRFLFASGWGNLNPTTQEGWYVDDVAVEVRFALAGPDVVAIAEEAAPSAESAPGWTIGGANPSWAYGIATTGPEGELAFATNLHGFYNRDECSWIESPPVPGAVLANDPTLRFDHWYEIYGSSSAGVAWSGGVVLVSTDGGATWQYLAMDAYTRESRYTDLRGCISGIASDAPTYPMVFAGDATRESVEADLSAYADAGTLQFRFVLGDGISINRLGWYVQSVEVGGVPLL